MSRHQSAEISSNGSSCRICAGVGLVNGGHTLFGRNAQVVYEVQVGEEVEGVRQEVRHEVKVEEK